MFPKRHFRAFIHYPHFDDTDRWEDDLQELAAHGIRFVILSRGFDLKATLADEGRKQRLVQFFDAADAHQIRCILNPGDPRELYLQPDARRWRLDYVKHVAETLGDHPGVYALLLEEHPTGGAHVSIERWKPLTAELEGRLEGQSLTEDGYQHAIKTWQMEQYSAYVKALVSNVKKTCSSLKTAISFHLDALFPRNTLVHFQDTARQLDFVLVDAACGWRGDPYEGRYLTRFVTDLAAALTDKEIWVTVGAHIERRRYQPGLHEIREWTRQALDHGAHAIGWSGWDAAHWDDRYALRGIPLAEHDPARWATLLTLSRSAVERERKAPGVSPHACLLAYDTLVNRLSSYADVFVPHLILGEYSHLNPAYVTDTQLSGKNALQKRKTLFTTPCPSVREAVIERLLAFMQAGGWVIAAADDCALDEQLRRSDARQRLFGIQEEALLGHDERILLEADLAYLSKGAALPAAWYRTRIVRHEEHVRVLGRWGDGSPAILLTPFEKGGALYIATHPYRAVTASRETEGWIRFFRSVAEPGALNTLNR